MDSPVHIPREAVASTVHLRSGIPESHPSAAVLGTERLGVGVAVGTHRVLTAHYLVMGAGEVAVRAADGRERRVEKYVVDHESGLALLFLGGPGLFPARLATGERIHAGLPVFLMSCTQEAEWKGASGHILAIQEFEAFWEYMLDRALLTTILNPGLAGAPLFNGAGRLVGVVSLGLGVVGRYSLAIPLELYLHRREYFEQGDSRPADGSRAWIGFYPQGQDGSVVVTGVVAGGPADRAGLERGDLILSVDGAAVSNLRELYRALWRRAPGESVGFQILREATLRVVHVVAGDRYEFYR